MNTFEKLSETLMRELRLIHAPVAIKYFYDQKELDSFKETQPHYSPMKPLTFCQSEVGARMEGITVIVEREKMGCTNASFVFGWKELANPKSKATSSTAPMPTMPARCLKPSPMFRPICWP